jgi:hypothetical protein
MVFHLLPTFEMPHYEEYWSLYLPLDPTLEDNFKDLKIPQKEVHSPFLDDPIYFHLQI